MPDVLQSLDSALYSQLCFYWYIFDVCVCVMCVCLQYSDSALYTQLCFYQYIFDVEKAKTLLTAAEKGEL